IRRTDVRILDAGAGDLHLGEFLEILFVVGLGSDGRSPGNRRREEDGSNRSANEATPIGRASHWYPPESFSSLVGTPATARNTVVPMRERLGKWIPEMKFQNIVAAGATNQPLRVASGGMSSASAGARTHWPAPRPSFNYCSAYSSCF